MTASLEERFWPKVAIRGRDVCWRWLAATDGHGYGAISAQGERRTLQAHRVSYELANGPIPAGLHVLHRCDNPACVNPSHLFLGTHAENMSDMAVKGRIGRRTKLSPETIRSICVASGSIRSIARRFGVSSDPVRKIRARAGLSGARS